MFDSPHDLSDLSDLAPERLEAEITEQAAHLDAGTCRFLLLVAEFDRREAWKPWGCRSCAHWLSWQCGIALGPAREQVRVARALEHLPRVREAFARGELSYSKARALTRIATPGIEQDLVQMARHATAAQLERLVRGYRGALVGSEGANRRHERRYLRTYVDEDGSLVVRARLDPEDGEVVMKAIDQAVRAARAERQGDGDVSAETQQERHPTAGMGPLGPMRVSAETLNGHGVSAETPPGDVEDVWGAERADALGVIAASYLAGGRDRLPADEGSLLVVHVDASTLAHDEGAPPHLEDGGGISPEGARRLGCDASVVEVLTGERGEPLSVGRRRRSIPPSIRRALRVRDRGCRFPTCTQARRLVAHHVRHWARGGETSLDNLVELCRFHHRAVHEGGFDVRATRPGVFSFHRPNGSRIPSRPAREARGDPEELPRRHREMGLDIGPQTAIARWDGSNPDYGWIVSGLLVRAGLSD